ncbi:D-Ala-D-Ala carboxypeptidase family metallohydrolase [Hellea sp.]|nr:D-Ala-D-Ala carboxypeptidase family metallohydrolase [Hellea sp.]
MARLKSWRIFAIALSLIVSSPIAAAANMPDRLGFTASFHGVTSDLSTLMTTVMPSEMIEIKTVATPSVTAGDLSFTGTSWQWTAPPAPGRHEMTLTHGGETMTLQIFVLTPFRNLEQSSLNGYKVGAYRKTLFKGLPNYAAPKGFIDLSAGPKNLKISPHFTLGQFICKQQPGHDPTYLLVQPETLIKLETLLEAANKKGWNAKSFHVMSGFRTPHYNRSIGNRTTSSRHLYGDATDIWLDGDGDGRMDDLNGDGKITKDDARALAKLAESLAAKGGRNWPSGGVGVYGPNSARGPFIHIDSRGYRARWGQ